MEKSLSFNEGRFRVMLVGDPHEKDRLETQEDRDKAQDYLDLQYAAVEKLKPDLVILMGDNASGKSPESIREVLMRITAPYRENDIPFAFVLGNHDLESSVADIDVLYDIYRTLPGCLLPSKDEVNSYGDYNLTVKSEKNASDALNFWLIYSGNRAEKKYNSYYDFVKTPQLEDYKRKAQLLAEKNGGTVPAVLIQHMPVPEEGKLLVKTGPLSLLFDGVRGINGQEHAYFRLSDKAEGYMGEYICPPDFNNGEFAAWKEVGDIFAAFFGHDHLNDFTGVVDGILLGQCKLSGFRQYGDGLRQGVRVLDFEEENVRDMKTYMVRYRELIGNKCRSIKGLNLLPDRITVKIDVLVKAAPYIGGCLALLAVRKLIKAAKSK